MKETKTSNVVVAESKQLGAVASLLRGADISTWELILRQGSGNAALCLRVLSNAV